MARATASQLMQQALGIAQKSSYRNPALKNPPPSDWVHEDTLHRVINNVIISHAIREAAAEVGVTNIHPHEMASLTENAELRCNRRPRSDMTWISPDEALAKIQKTWSCCAQAIKAGFSQAELDWRPGETMPEDYNAFAPSFSPHWWI